MTDSQDKIIVTLYILIPQLALFEKIGEIFIWEIASKDSITAKDDCLKMTQDSQSESP